MLGEDVTYATAQALASADSVTLTSLYIGQDLGFKVYRSYLYFDTSFLGASATITAAVLSLWCNSKAGTDTNFDITVQGDYAFADPLVVTDFDKTLYTTGGGTLGTADITAGQYNDLTLSETGRGWISLTGWTKLCLRSSRDIAGTEPSGEEFIVMESGATVNKWPKLTVTCTLPLWGAGELGYEYNNALEVIRRCEKVGLGRFYMDTTGQAAYESRFARSA